MRWFERAIAAVAPQYALKREVARVRMQAVRAHEGASKADGWRPHRPGASANTDHLYDARELRVRARSLVQNVPYCARALQVLVNAAIGTGITPKFEGRDGEKLGKLLERWSAVADADGRFDFYGLQAAAERAMRQDGEVLIRRRWRKASDGLPVPMQVQLLEIDWLDDSKNGTLAGGGRIINGKQYDTLGRVTGYWLHPAHPGDLGAGSLRLGPSTFVPAKDIIHYYAATRPGQSRGFTIFASVIARVRDLMLYEDAELQRKNLETRLSVLVSGDKDAYRNDEAGTMPSSDTYNDLGSLPSGGVTQVAPGSAITTVEPKPAGDYVEYCKFALHLILAGLGVPYESGTGDLRGASWSSGRMRNQEFRRETEQHQWLVCIPGLCAPLLAWFREAAVLAGERSAADAAVEWSTTRWDYVNPQQDIRAELDAIGGALMSPSESLRRRGYDPKKVFEEMGADFKAMEASGALDLMRFMQTSGQKTTDTPQED